MKKIMLAIAAIYFLAPGVAFAEKKVWEHTVYSGLDLRVIMKEFFLLCSGFLTDNVS